MDIEAAKEKLWTAVWHVENEWGVKDAQGKVLNLLREVLGVGPKQPEAAKPETSSPGSQTKRTLAVVVGHNARAQGAEAPGIGSEFELNNLVADEMIRLAPPWLKVVKINRQPATNAGTEIRAAYRLVDAADPDASIELHFNAATPGANGTETIHGSGADSRKLAGFVQTSMTSALGLRNRGLVFRARDDRGGISVNVGKCPGILVEPFFATSPSDVAAAKRLGVTGFAQMYLKGCIDYLNTLS